VLPTDEETQTYLLCDDCENILSRGGETWVVGDAGNTPASCSQFCIVHMGGKFVLASKGHVYHLDHQDLPRGFVGEKVKVRGFLDPKTEIIRMVNIETE
jgi:hypothetical protein